MSTRFPLHLQPVVKHVLVVERHCTAMFHSALATARARVLTFNVFSYAIVAVNTVAAGLTMYTLILTANDVLPARRTTHAV